MSRTKYPHIFREGKIGNVTIPNRLCMSPMGVGNYSEFFEDRLIDFYGARARGGIGLVFFENNYVSSIAEDPYPRFMPVPRFDDRRKISSTYSIVKRVRNYGAVAGVQLGAGQGRFADVVDPDHPPMGASAYPCFKDPSVICIPMTEEDIAKKVAAFKRAAAMALECGFQVLELHAHAGYLLEQFLSKDLNKRTDKYGGSAENRFRFAKEILDGIREVVGDQLAISIRLSVDQKSEAGDGITFEEGLEYCKLAEKAGFDVINVDAGSHKNMDWVIPSPYIGETPLLYIAREVKKNVNIPVISVGAYLMPELAEKALAAGDVDFISLGREVLADPDWAKKAKLGREDEIRGCIQCNEMCTGHTSTAKAATCALNPRCGREFEFEHMGKAEVPKRVTIVGAGPAGLNTAIEAKKRGHTVKVLEKSGEVGGKLGLIGREKDKAGIRNYHRYLKRMVELQDIDVELNCEATVEKIKATNPDVAVVAAGAELFIPGIPGFDSDKVVTIEGLHDRELKGDETVVVLGGGVVGCEAALILGRAGHKVTVVEMFDTFAKDQIFINRLSLLDQINRTGNVTLMPNTKCKCLTDKEMICIDANGNETALPYDLVVAAAGLKPNNAIAKAVEEEFDEVYVINDVTTQGKIGEAVHRGFYTAIRI